MHAGILSTGDRIPDPIMSYEDLIYHLHCQKLNNQSQSSQNQISQNQISQNQIS